jgi:protein-tyrosine-phosphatase
MEAWETQMPRCGAAAPLALFVCRLNIAASIMAEAILRHLAQERLRAASAGEVVGRPVSRYALECLSARGIRTEQLTSKSWGEFFGLGRPTVRFLIALGDVYAAKASWPEDTLIAEWPMADPATAGGSEPEIRHAFEVAFATLHTRVRLLLALPLARLDGAELTRELAHIGKQP